MTFTRGQGPPFQGNSVASGLNSVTNMAPPPNVRPAGAGGAPNNPDMQAVQDPSRFRMAPFIGPGGAPATENQGPGPRRGQAMSGDPIPVRVISERDRMRNHINDQKIAATLPPLCHVPPSLQHMVVEPMPMAKGNPPENQGQTGMGGPLLNRMQAPGQQGVGGMGGMPPQGNGMAPMGNAMMQMGNGMMQMGNGMAPMGNGMASMGNDMASMGNGMAPMGNAMMQMKNGMMQIGNSMVSMGNGMAPMGNSMPSMGNALPPMNNIMPPMDNNMGHMGNAMPSMGNAVPYPDNAMMGMMNHNTMPGPVSGGNMVGPNSGMAPKMPQMMSNGAPMTLLDMSGMLNVPHNLISNQMDQTMASTTNMEMPVMTNVDLMPTQGGMAPIYMNMNGQVPSQIHLPSSGNVVGVNIPGMGGHNGARASRAVDPNCTQPPVKSKQPTMDSSD